MQALWQLSATALIAGFGRRDFTPTAVLQACLARIDQLQPRLNAFVSLRAEAALAEAAASTERWRRGQPVGALDGLPLAVKDNIPSADLPTTWGSPG